MSKESLRKTEEKPGVALIDRPTTAQRMYVRYVSHTLIDLTILNLFIEGVMTIAPAAIPIDVSAISTRGYYDDNSEHIKNRPGRSWNYE